MVSAGREAVRMCYGARAVTFPMSWGAAGGSALHRHPLPCSALPQSVQCPKEAKEPCGGRDAGGAPDARWGWLVWVQALWGPSFPCGSLQPRGPALLPGVVALSSHPRPTVSFPNKGHFLHTCASSLPRDGDAPLGCPPLAVHMRVAAAGAAAGAARCLRGCLALEGPAEHREGETRGLWALPGPGSRRL